VSWAHLSDRHPVARKQHRCFACWTVIEVGQKHIYRVGVYDGDIQTARFHYECEAFAFSDETECDPCSVDRCEAIEFYAAKHAEATP